MKAWVCMRATVIEDEGRRLYFRSVTGDADPIGATYDEGAEGFLRKACGLTTELDVEIEATLNGEWEVVDARVVSYQAIDPNDERTAREAAQRWAARRDGER